MTGPFIFIATNRLKQGKLNTEKKRLPDLIDFHPGQRTTADGIQRVRQRGRQ